MVGWWRRRSQPVGVPRHGSRATDLDDLRHPRTRRNSRDAETGLLPTGPPGRPRRPPALTPVHGDSARPGSATDSGIRPLSRAARWLGPAALLWGLLAVLARVSAPWAAIATDVLFNLAFPLTYLALVGALVD